MTKLCGPLRKKNKVQEHLIHGPQLESVIYQIHTSLSLWVFVNYNRTMILNNTQYKCRSRQIMMFLSWIAGVSFYEFCSTILIPYEPFKMQGSSQMCKRNFWPRWREKTGDWWPEIWLLLPTPH